MKRITFSIYNDNVVQNHKSTNDFKLNQFRKYKQRLVEEQMKYAEACSSDYTLIETSTTDYNSIQFEKIKQLENFAQDYDEVLYLDLDVVPHTSFANIFEDNDTSTMCIHPLDRSINDVNMKIFLEYDSFDTQNVFCKTAAKKSMLFLDDIYGNDLLYNTGVVLGGSEVIKRLNFMEQLDDLHKLLDEAREESLYPEEITRNFYYNNEVYISYLIERDNIPCTNLGMQWNFILDGYQPEPSAACYLLHHVNKEFEKSFDA